MENKCRKCGKVIGEIYTDKILRCDTCREKVNSELEGENRGLKVAVQTLHDEIVEQDKEYQTLCEMNLKLLEENKKLKADLDKRQQGKYRYFGNDGETDLYEDA